MKCKVNNTTTLLQYFRIKDDAVTFMSEVKCYFFYHCLICVACILYQFYKVTTDEALNILKSWI